MVHVVAGRHSSYRPNKGEKPRPVCRVPLLLVSGTHCVTNCCRSRVETDNSFETQQKLRNIGEDVTYDENGTMHHNLYVAYKRHNPDIDEMEYYLLRDDRQDPGFGWVKGEFLKTPKEL